jgi:hypothetical protein
MTETAIDLRNLDVIPSPGRQQTRLGLRAQDTDPS